MERASFTEVSQEVLDRHGHMLDKVKHFTNDPKLNQLEANRVAVLMESAVQAFCSKKNCTYAQLQQVATEANINVSGDAVAFVKIQLPLIAKVYPNMISREFVSVQPISQPTAQIFYKDIVRATTDASLSTAIRANKDYANNVEYNEASPTVIAKIKAKITADSITATQKKLMREITVEAEQDFYAYHGMSLGSELDAELPVEITREWDSTILQAIEDGATAGNVNFSMATPAGLTYTERKHWIETFVEALIDADTLVYTKTYRRTNVVIVNATIAGFMSKAQGFVMTQDGTDNMEIATGGRYFMGTLNGRWRVYVDPIRTSNKCLVFWNNPGNWMDTCFVWAPYILAFFSDIFTDPETFVQKRAMLSRSAMKCVRGDMIATVTVSSS